MIYFFIALVTGVIFYVVLYNLNGKNDYQEILSSYFEKLGYDLVESKTPEILEFNGPFGIEVKAPVILINNTPISFDKTVIRKVVILDKNKSIEKKVWVKIYFSSKNDIEIKTIPKHIN